jgi:hypothetical protein
MNMKKTTPTRTIHRKTTPPVVAQKPRPAPAPQPAPAPTPVAAPEVPPTPLIVENGVEPSPEAEPVEIELETTPSAPKVTVRLMDGNETVEHVRLKMPAANRRPMITHGGSLYVASHVQPNGMWVYRWER